MKVICISGHAQNGKDTSAAIMKNFLEASGYKVLVTHYGDLVKYICTTFFDWNGEKDERGRTLLQYVGTDVIRKRAPSYWVDFILGVLSLFQGAWDYVLIADTRFKNEVSCVKEVFENSYHVRVERPNFDNGLTEEQKKHPSEVDLDDVEADYYINNCGSLEELQAIVYGVLINIMGEHKMTIDEYKLLRSANHLEDDSEREK